MLTPLQPRKNKVYIYNNSDDIVSELPSYVYSKIYEDVQKDLINDIGIYVLVLMLLPVIALIFALV